MGFTTKAQIADLDKQIDASGGLPMDASGLTDAANGLEDDFSQGKLEDRITNAYEEIITVPNESALPEEVITLLRNQQMEISQQAQ